MLTVCGVLKESLRTTLQFVSWYLEQGADQIILCFDDPQDAAIEVLKDTPKVRCVRCTPEFWRSIGMTVDRRFTRRQNRAVQKFYREQEEGWFLHVDGDELVHLEGRTLAEELKITDPDVRAVQILPVENIQTDQPEGVAHFRLLMSRRAVRRIYTGQHGAMQRRQGLSGHTEGKCATRAGLVDAQMRQHFMHYADGAAIIDRTIGPEEGAYLLHFFDQGYDVWRNKVPWRMSAAGYRGLLGEMMREILDGPEPEEEMRKLYDFMHFFDAERIEKLKQWDAHLSLELDLDGLVTKHFPKLGDLLDGPAVYAA